MANELRIHLDMFMRMSMQPSIYEVHSFNLSQPGRETTDCLTQTIVSPSRISPSMKNHGCILSDLELNINESSAFI